MSSSFGVVSAKENDPNAFMKIETISSPYKNDGILSLFRSSSSLNSASYRISYSFPRDLTGEWRSFAKGSVCLTTTPYASKNYRYDDRFYITLVRKGGWFGNDIIGTKIARVNEGEQNFRWDNITAGEYRLELRKYDLFGENSTVYFRDDKFPTALFQNCGHW